MWFTNMQLTATTRKLVKELIACIEKCHINQSEAPKTL